jgi:hypothetical protein
MRSDLWITIQNMASPELIERLGLREAQDPNIWLVRLIDEIERPELTHSKSVMKRVELQRKTQANDPSLHHPRCRRKEHAHCIHNCTIQLRERIDQVCLICAPV